MIDPGALAQAIADLDSQPRDWDRTLPDRSAAPGLRSQYVEALFAAQGAVVESWNEAWIARDRPDVYADLCVCAYWHKVIAGYDGPDYSRALDGLQAEIELLGRGEDVIAPVADAILAAQARVIDYFLQLLTEMVRRMMDADSGEQSYEEEDRHSIESRYAEILVALATAMPGEPIAKREFLAQSLAELDGLTWEKRRFICYPALVSVDGEIVMRYDGRTYNPSVFRLVQNGWRHEHCRVCLATITESEDPNLGIAFTNDGRWVCTRCYVSLVVPYANGKMAIADD